MTRDWWETRRSECELFVSGVVVADCARVCTPDNGPAPSPLTVAIRSAASTIVAPRCAGLPLTNEPDPVPLQHIRQFRMVDEHPRFSRIQLANATIEHSMDVLSDQARHVDQPLDMGVLRMDRLRECAPRRVVSRMGRIARRTNSDTAIPAKIEERQLRPRRDPCPVTSVVSFNPTSRFRRRVNLSRTRFLRRRWRSRAMRRGRCSRRLASKTGNQRDRSPEERPDSAPA